MKVTKNHKGCVASAKRNQLLFFGDRNLSSFWPSGGGGRGGGERGFYTWGCVSGLKDLYDY